MSNSDKRVLFYVCVENPDDLSVAWRIYTFLRLMGAKYVFCPVFKQTCILLDKKLQSKLKRKFEKIVVVCIMRGAILIRRDDRILLYPWKRMSLLDKLKYALYIRLYTKLPRFISRYFWYFSLGAFNWEDKQIAEILLSMDIIEKGSEDPLAVFIHELLHIKRLEHCSVEGCIGNIYNKAGYVMCKECRKLLKEIIKGNF